MNRIRLTGLGLALTLTVSFVAPSTAAAIDAPADAVVTDFYRSAARTWTVSNVVVDGRSIPSVEQCYNSKPCETIPLPIPADAPGGARVESVVGPSRYNSLATGVTYSSAGALPTTWLLDQNRRPWNHWLVQTAPLTDAYGTGLNAIAVTGSAHATSNSVTVLRRTTPAPPNRGTDLLVERAGSVYRLMNPLGCPTRTWTVNDVVQIRSQLTFIGNCGTATSALPRVYIWKSDGVVDVTRELPDGVRWTRADQARRASNDVRSDLVVSGEPVDGGPTVSYRLAFGHWVPGT